MWEHEAIWHLNKTSKGGGIQSINPFEKLV